MCRYSCSITLSKQTILEESNGQEETEGTELDRTQLTLNPSQFVGFLQGKWITSPV